MIAVLNVGSSTFKWRLFDPSGTELQRHEGADARGQFLELLKRDQGIDVIAHRVVHGGMRYFTAIEVTDEVIVYLKSIEDIAPLHNPPAVSTIEETRAIAPAVRHFADFDTGFFRDLPMYAAVYPLPYSWYEQYHIRRFGFHGLSHEYAAHEGSRQLNRPLEMLKLITVHLGAGSSVAAISGGKAVETSMGFTPLEGLMMERRSGDIDPAIIFYLLRQGVSKDKLEQILYEESGMKGIAGEGDMQKLLTRSDERTLLALDMFIHRIRKYIGAYMAILGGLDAIIMTGAIGTGSEYIRSRVRAGLDIFGDFQFLTVETNEERMIFRHIQPLISSGASSQEPTPSPHDAGVPSRSKADPRLIPE